MPKKSLPARFCAADPDTPCKICEKIRKLCRYCEKCYQHCECPICYHCGRAKEGFAAEWFIAEVNNNAKNDGKEGCQCEFCNECGKLTDGETLCAISNNNKRWCHSCFEKLGYNETTEWVIDIEKQTEFMQIANDLASKTAEFRDKLSKAMPVIVPSKA